MPLQEAVFSELARGHKAEVEEVDMEERKVIESSVDPIKWKTELERVSAKLKPPQALGAREWREHIEQTKKNEETIQRVFGESRGQLQAMSEDLAAALERLASKENYINSQFDHLKQEFGTVSERRT
jgi:intraflagellar transport protein 57